MDTPKGKFIVIDGIDGSGKTTQTDLLISRLQNEGFLVETISFPQYNQKSAGLVEEYLDGKYGPLEEVGAKRASIFYACDRYDASFQVQKWIQAGKYVIANRYTSSNMGHQGAKIDDPSERQKFFTWLDDLEYQVFQIPRPDLNIILDVEAEIAQKLAQDRNKEDWEGKKKDIHEENLNHLKKARNIYLEITNTLPQTKTIKCTENNQILSREKIHEMIWKAVKS